MQKPSTLTTRIIARFIDVAIMNLILFGGIGVFLLVSDDVEKGQVWDIIGGIAIFFILFITFGLNTFLTYTQQHTIGKRLMGLVVIKENGKELNLWQSIVREILFKEILYLISILLIISSVTFFSEKTKDKMLHDLALKTVVLNRSEKTLPPWLGILIGLGIYAMTVGVFFGTSYLNSQNTISEEEVPMEEEFIGFGSSEPDEDLEYNEEDFDYDEFMRENEELGMSFSDDGVVGEPGMPTPKTYAFTYMSPSGDKEFDILIKPSSFDNVLTIDNTNFSYTGAYRGSWSEDESLVMFSAVEGDREEGHTEFYDIGNIWVVNADGSGLKKVYDLENLDAINYISNGTRIGFATTSIVGVMDKNGDNLEILHEFTPDSRAIIPTAPEVKAIESNQFSIHIQENGMINTMTFEL